jgi:hypothetical protein
MKILRILAINSIALFCAQAFAQEASTPAQSSQDAAALSVGGSIPPLTAMGAPTRTSREQVYRELVQSQTDGEAATMRDLFKGER